MIEFLKELDSLMKKHNIKFIYAEDECHNNHPITIDNGCDDYVKFQGEINDITIADKIKELSSELKDDEILIRHRVFVVDGNNETVRTIAETKAHRNEIDKVELIGGKTHLFLKNGMDFDVENSYNEMVSFMKGDKNNKK